jgi:predicted porin
MSTLVYCRCVCGNSNIRRAMSAHTNRIVLLALSAGTGLWLMLAARHARGTESSPNDSAASEASRASDVPTGTPPPTVPETPSALARLNIEFYGAFLPFVEHVSVTGATPAGYAGGASQVQGSLYTGINAPARFRMTAGTTNIGFRGRLDLFQQLQLVWQVENGVPIDGTGPPNTFASRNSHVGFAGGWGTLIWGNWDTPWKWATLVTINPIPGGFVPDYTAVLSTPGFGVSALNTTSLLQGDLGRAPFYRHEANSIQYWSPTVAGFSTRLSVTLNEDTPNPTDALVPSNPYMFSGYLGFDGGGLRVRYAYEMHHDFFGMYQLGAFPSDAATSSTDQGHQLTIQYVLALKAEVRTRVVATGEYLSYKSTDAVTDAFDAYSRPAYYVLVEQTVFGHHLWAAYGQDFEGKCHRVGGAACSTTGLGARMVSAGYLYAFNPTTDVYLAGYRIINDVSSMHSTFPALYPGAPGVPGADMTGVGMGIFYAFDIGIGR